jgi:hypothetical protein
MCNNLPIGTTDDPRAPWNINSDLCRYCDEGTIREEFLCENYTKEQIENGEVDEDAMEDYISEYNLCHDCYEEDIADQDEG